MSVVRRHRPLVAIVAWLAAVGLTISVLACLSKPKEPLLIAPMIHGINLCQLPEGGGEPDSEADLAALCRDLGRSPAALVEAALADLGGSEPNRRDFLLGYTLPVPLLDLFVDSPAGWQIDQPAVERLAQAVRETPRPLVLHLFSTHFATGAPIETFLASDPSNLAHSPGGPMSKDRFMGIDVYPWTIAATDNDITRYRRQALEQVLSAICRLPELDRTKIRAVTLLGEVHHFHADFEQGMGVSGDYVVSDYSEVSVAGFRQFLAERFRRADLLNEALGTSFDSFEAITPPDRDIGNQAGASLAQHIDSAAGGSLPLTGWAIDVGSGKTEPVWIRIYRNGELIARVPARYGRQDVLQARPELGTADVGWRYDMDFTDLAPGSYRIDFLAERAGGALAMLGSRRVVLAAQPSAGSAPVAESQRPSTSEAPGLAGHIDHPPDLAVVRFNPLVPLWHEFRNRQVVDYLLHFERLVRDSCLARVPLYTHQIAPFVNPSWDASKFAVDASLRGAGGLRLGISLYGEATYGHSFFDWLHATGGREYGVTEFHPLKAMSPSELRAVLERHQQSGARFLSFFLDIRPRAVRDEARSNIFAFDPANPQFGSDALYQAVRTVLND